MDGELSSWVDPRMAKLGAKVLSKQPAPPEQSGMRDSRSLKLRQSLDNRGEVQRSPFVARRAE